MSEIVNLDQLKMCTVRRLWERKDSNLIFLIWVATGHGAPYCGEEGYKAIRKKLYWILVSDRGFYNPYCYDDFTDAYIRQKLPNYILICSVQLLSHVQLFETPWTVAPQTSLPWGFSRQEYWSGLPCPPPGDLLHPGVESRSSALQADSLPSEPPGKPYNYINCIKNKSNKYSIQK